MTTITLDYELQSMAANAIALAAPATAPATAPDELERLRAESEERLQNCAALIAENEQLRKNADRMREALTFYAQGEHFHFDRAAWDTVSGEPQNYWCDEEGTATVEDGTIAKLAIDAATKGTP